MKFNIILVLCLLIYVVGKSQSNCSDYERILLSSENSIDSVDLTIGEYKNGLDSHKSYNETNNGWVKSIKGCEIRTVFTTLGRSGVYKYYGNCKASLANGEGVIKGFTMYNDDIVETFRQNSIYENGKQTKYLHIMNLESIFIFPEFKNSNRVLGFEFKRRAGVKSLPTALRLVELILSKINIDSSIDEVIKFQKNRPGLYFAIVEYNTLEANGYRFPRSISFQPNGRVLSVGSQQIRVNNYRNSKKEGVFEIYTDKDSTIRKGIIRKFRSDKIVSIREFGKKAIMDECILGDCINGEGVMRYANGDVFTGQFKGRLYHGHGNYTWTNNADKDDNVNQNDSYIGDWNNGLIHGNGKLIKDDGQVWEGNFERGRIVGLKGSYLAGNASNFTQDYNEKSVKDRLVNSNEIDCELEVKSSLDVVIRNGVDCQVNLVDCFSSGSWSKKIYEYTIDKSLGSKEYYEIGTLNDSYLGTEYYTSLQKICNCK